MPQDPYASYGGSALAVPGQSVDPYAAYGGSAHDSTPHVPVAPSQQGFLSSFGETSGLSLLGHALMHPIDSAATVLDAGKQVFTPANANVPLSQSQNPLLKSIGNAVDTEKAQLGKVVSDVRAGGLRPSKGINVGEDVMRAIPVAGGVYAKATSQADAGNYMGAAGSVLGLGAGLAGPELAAKGAQAVAPAVAHPLETLATPLRSGLDEPLPGTWLTPRARYQSAQRLGVQLDAADATNHPLLTGAKAVNQHSLLGSPAYEAAKARNLSQLHAATDDLLTQASPIADAQGRGALVQNDLRANQQGLRNGSDAGFSSLDQMTGGAPVPGASKVGQHARNLLDQNQGFFTKYPFAEPTTPVRILKDLSKVDDTASYADLQRLRSNTYEATKNNNDLVKDQGTAMLQQATQQLDNAITSSGLTPQQAAVFRDANAKWADLKGTYDDPSSPFYSAVRKATPESLATGVGGPSATNVQNMFGRITPDAQGAVQRSVAEKLLGTNSTGDPRFVGFGTRLYATPQGYRDALFTPEQNQTLGDLANTTHAMNADLNPSGSGKLLHKVGDMSALASSGVAALTGHVAPLVGDLAYNAGQYGLSKVINSPRFTNFLMKEPGVAGGGPTPLPVLPVGGGNNPTSAPRLTPVSKPNSLSPLYGDGAGLASLYSKPAAAADASTAARIAGIDGADTQVHTPNGSLPAKYRLAEADDLNPSHDAQTFKPNPNYPQGVQERDYAGSREAQLRVIQQAQNYKPELTLSDDPTGANGGPIVAPDGTVLGGNSRTMALQRLYQAGKDQGGAKAYLTMLKDRAARFGIDPAAVDNFNKPVLTKEVNPAGGAEGMRRLGSDLNKGMTGALGGSEKAVSMGKSISPATLQSVQAMLDEAGLGASLRDVMSDPASANNFLQKMQKDGIITAAERPQYVESGTGGMTPEGKMLFEKALLGAAIGDPATMEAVPKAILGKLGSSIGPISSLAARGDEFNILPELRSAVREHTKMATTGMGVDNHFAQGGMFGEQATPAAEQMTRLLAKNPNAVREALSSFAKDARQSPEGQTSLLGMSGPSAEEAWIKAFGPILQRRSVVSAPLQDPPQLTPLPSLQPRAKDLTSLSLPPALLRRPGLATLAAQPIVAQLQAPRVGFLRPSGLYGRGDAA